MTINLPDEIQKHFIRVRDLADEAADDDDQGFQSRASAMTAMSSILKELTKTQESLVHMDRLMKIESVIIETCKDCLSEEGLTHFITKLEQRLAQL